MTLYLPPTQNALQYTLDTQLAAAGTSLTLNSSVAGIVQAPGVFVIDRVDSSGNETASKREYISFTGVSGANLTGLVRGLAGSTDQVHSVGAVVEFVPDVIQQQGIYDALTLDHSIIGAHTSLPSIGQIRAFNIVGWSAASLNSADIRTLAVPSLASIQQLYISNLINASGASIVGISSATADPLYLNNLGIASLASLNQVRVTQHFNASSASLSGVFPSGASGSVLTSVGATFPVFAPATSALSSKIITSTRDLAAATGNVAYTGAGFTPTSIIAIMGATGSEPFSVGFADSAKTSYSLSGYGTGDAKTISAALFYIDVDAANNKQTATVASYDADGFTLTWTKTGSPTGTYTITFICYK